MNDWERLLIYVGESAHWHGQPVYMALLEAARQQGLVGGTVMRGVAGFGKNRQLHTGHILELSSDLPMVVTIIDRADAINAFLPLVQQMVQGGIVLREAVQVVHHAPVDPVPTDPT